MSGLQKMKLKAYADKSFKGTPIVSMVVLVNPESYKLTKNVKYSENRKLGTGDTTVHFNKYEKEDLSFSIVFDGTGVIPGTGLFSVMDKIDELEKTVYQCSSKIHQPNYVRILWGDLLFDGQISGYTLNYTLFSPEGIPLRVKVDMSFDRSISEDITIRRSEQGELQEMRVEMKEGGLSTHCVELYGDALKARQVAQKNKLNSIRNVKPGTKVTFPKK